jgi:hypothetical protein
MYKKRDRYKEEMANYFKEEAKKEFKGLMSEMISNPPLELSAFRDRGVPQADE